MERKEFLMLVQKFLEARNQICTRPLPVLLGGKEVDLFKLKIEVTVTGGYDAAQGSWSLIAEHLGFGPECGPGLKLIYVKYLKALGSWTQLASREDENVVQFHSSSTKMNLWMMCDGSKQYKSQMDKKPLKRILQDREVRSSVKDMEGQLINEEILFQDTPELCFDKKSCGATSKRRRRGSKSLNSSLDHSTSLTGILQWIKRIALNPGDPKIGQGSRGFKKNENLVEECLSRASKIRALLWGKREFVPVYTPRDYALGLTTKLLPPSVCYQELPKPDKQALERLRATQKRAEYYGFHHIMCAKVSQTDKTKQGFESIQSDQLMAKLPRAFLTAMTEMSSLGDLLARSRKRIPIGPDFQATLPSWSNPSKVKSAKSPGKMCQATFNDLSVSVDPEYDRYLGTVLWPLCECTRASSKEKVGKGRLPGCFCICPGSVECVKLHVQVERERLRLELGEAFDSLGLSHMGETVSESWLPEEESSFREIVRMNPLSNDKNFWDELPAALPSKSMEKLISYYFNVFVLRRRAIQNRLMLEPIDSDDDEVEIPGSKYLQNERIKKKADGGMFQG